MPGERTAVSPVSSLISITKINDHLYLSGFGPVSDQAIKERAITCVIDATNIPSRGRPNVEFLKIAVDDSDFARLDRYML